MEQPTVSSSTTVLVTGATGFAGSHTVKALAERDDVQVVAACRDPAALPADFRGEVRAGDLTDPRYREDALRDVDVVVHCASWTAAWGHAKQSREHHLRPTLELIGDAMALGVRRFVHISSTAIAAPEGAADAMSHPEPLPHFPHLDNVRRIEETLRERAGEGLEVVNLRLGFFVGTHYGLGILPLLLPRLKTHLVPWVSGGRTHLPLIDGRDVGQALALAATTPGLAGYRSFNVIGPENPTVREVLEHLATEYGVPAPRFSVPFAGAYAFAWLMEKLDPLVPWEPLVTRSIVQFLEEQVVDNEAFTAATGYVPKHRWQDAIQAQLSEMATRQARPMPMIKPLPNDIA